jgi:hypothetical protein
MLITEHVSAFSYNQNHYLLWDKKVRDIAFEFNWRTVMKYRKILTEIYIILVVF